MSEEVITPPVEETPSTPETTAEQTISEIAAEVTETPKQETVGLDKYMKEKKTRQDLEKQLADLKSSIEQGASKTDVSSDIASLAEEHGIDKEFLAKFANTIKAQAEKGIDEKLKPFTDKENKAKIDSVFNTHYAAAIAKMPEYEGIVNADVIKTLSLNPQNSSKTFSQLIEETYGNAITGRRTIERTTPGGGKDPEPLDFKKASSDINYFNEVMSNPKLKAEYNDKMLKSGF